MRTAKGALAFLAAGLCLVGVLAVDAQVVGGKKAAAPSVQSGVVTATGERKESVEKVLAALGPAIREQLSAGRTVAIPGVGTFRVVKVEAHRDLVAGRPAVVGDNNYVEFVPDPALNAAANAPGSVPSRTVPPGEFQVNPSANPGIRNDGARTGRTRTR